MRITFANELLFFIYIFTVGVCSRFGGALDLCKYSSFCSKIYLGLTSQALASLYVVWQYIASSIGK